MQAYLLSFLHFWRNQAHAGETRVNNNAYGIIADLAARMNSGT